VEDTIFYILGISLVVVALVLSAVGLRWPVFPPSRGVMVAIAVGVLALVGATATFAWMNAEEQQSEHAAEHAAERAAAAEEVAAGVIAAEGGAEEGPAEGQTGAGEDVAQPPAEPASTAVDGAAIFESAGCSGCHTLRAAGSTAQTGPDLDGALKGKSAQYIETSIVDPNAEIAKGFPPDVMPQNFGSALTPEEITAVVEYLVESTGGNG
jgi:predicted ribosomally synthesized peptide with SipW-like signal peptide